MASAGTEVSARIPTSASRRPASRAGADRALIAKGLDPIDHQRAARKASKPVPTFGDIAQFVIADAQSKSTNAKVRYQWERHLGDAYSGPLLARPVHEITTVDVAAVLRAVWRTKPEVARKLYPAIRRVFERARICSVTNTVSAWPIIPRDGKTSRRWGLKRLLSSVVAAIPHFRTLRCRSSWTICGRETLSPLARWSS
jgi:hypothetical protein